MAMADNMDIERIDDVNSRVRVGDDIGVKLFVLDDRVDYPMLNTVNVEVGDEFPPRRFMERDSLWATYYNLHYGDYTDFTNEFLNVVPRRFNNYNIEVVSRMFVEQPYIEGLKDDDNVNLRLQRALYQVAINTNRYGVGIVAGVNDDTDTILTSFDTRTWYPATDGDLFATVVTDPDTKQVEAIDIIIIPFAEAPYRRRFKYDGFRLWDDQGEADLPDVLPVPVLRPPEYETTQLGGTSMYASIAGLAVEEARRLSGISRSNDIAVRPFWQEDYDERKLREEAATLAGLTVDEFDEKSLVERLKIEQRFRNTALHYRAVGAERAIRGTEFVSWNLNTDSAETMIDKLKEMMDERIGIPFSADNSDRPPSGAAIEEMVKPQEQRVLDLRERIRLSTEQALQVVFEGAVLVWGNEDAQEEETQEEEEVTDGNNVPG